MAGGNAQLNIVIKGTDHAHEAFASVQSSLNELHQVAQGMASTFTQLSADVRTTASAFGTFKGKADSVSHAFTQNATHARSVETAYTGVSDKVNTTSGHFTSIHSVIGTVSSAFQTAGGAAGTAGGHLSTLGSKAVQLASHFGSLARSASASIFHGIVGAAGGLVHALTSAGSAALHLATHLGHMVAHNTASFFEGIAHHALHAMHSVEQLGHSVAHLTSHFGGEAILEAGDFQQSLLKIQYLTDANTTEMDKYRQASIQMGQDTTFTSKQAADNLVNLTKLHYEGTDAINVNSAAAKSAMLNNVDLDKATEALTSTLHSFGFTANDVTHVADQMNTATKLGKLNFDEYSNVMSRTGAVSRQTNQDIAALSAGLLAQTNAGDNTNHASQMLRSTLIGLAAPTDKAKAALKDLHVEVFGADGKMKDYADIIDQVTKGTKGMTDAQQDALLKDAFGKNNIVAVTDAMHAQFKTVKDGTEVTYQGADALREMEKQIRSSDGATDKAAKTMEQGFNFQLKQMKGSIGEAVIAIGTGLLPGASSIVQSFTGVVNKFIEMETKTHLLQNVFGAVGRVVNSVLGPAFDNLGHGIGTLYQFFDNLHHGMTPFNAALHATTQKTSYLIPLIMGAANAYDFFTQKIEPVAAQVIHLVETFSPLGIAVRAIIGFFNDGIPGAVDSLRVSVANIGNVIGVNLVDPFDKVVEVIGNVINFIHANAPQILQTIQSAFSQIITVVSNAISPIVGLVSKFIGDVVTFIVTNGPQIFQGFVNIFNGLVSFIGNVLNGLIAVISPVLTIIGNLWAAHGTQIMTTVLNVWTNISTTIGNVLTAVGTIIGNVLTAIGTFIQQNHTQIENIIVTVWNTISTVVDTVINTVSTVITTVVGGIVSFWQQNHATILSTAQTIWNTISTVVSTVIGAVSTVIKTTIDIISGFWKNWGDGILQVAKDIWNGISKAISDVIEIIKTVVQGFIDLFNGKWYNFGEDLKKVWNNAWNLVADAIKNIGKTIVDTISGFIRDAGNFILNFDWKGLGTSIIDGIVSGIVSIPGKIGDALKSIVGGGLSFVKGFLDSHSPSLKMAREVGQPMSEGIAKGITDNKDAVSSAATEAVSGALNSARAAARGASSIGNAIASGMASGVNAAANSVANAAASAAANAIAAAKSAIDSHSPSKKAHDEVGLPIAQGMLTGIQAGADAITQAASDVALGAIEHAQATIVASDGTSQEADRRIGGPLSRGIADGIHHATGIVLQATTDLTNATLERGKAAIGANGTSGASVFEESIGKGIDKGVAAGIVGHGERVALALNQVIQDALNSKSNVNALFQPVGQHIADGIADGLLRGSKVISDAATAAAQAALDAAQKALGIHSPSRVMADQVGTPIVQGIVMGMQSELPNLMAATQGITSRIASAPGGAGGSGFTYSLPASNNISGSSSLARGGGGAIPTTINSGDTHYHDHYELSASYAHPLEQDTLSTFRLMEMVSKLKVTS